MPVESVMRETLVQRDHLGITRSFCQNGSSGDFGYQTVPSYDCGYRALQARAVISVHQYPRGKQRQVLDGTFHGKQAGLKNIYAVNLPD